MSKSITEKQIQDFYLNPEFGLSAVSPFTAKLKSLGYKVTQKQVKEAIEKTEVNQTFSQKKKINRKQLLSIYGKDFNKNYVQADLAFIPEFKKQNRGYSVILTAININTRKAYAYPLKSKTVKDKNNKNIDSAEGIIPAFKKLIKDSKMNVLTTDNGVEFTNKSMKELLKDSNIEHYLNETEDHTTMGMVERFNRTLKLKFKKIEESKDTVNWIDYLDSVVKNYNSTQNSANIDKSTPDNMNLTKTIRNILLKRNNLTKLLEKIDIKPGDKVRIKIKTKTFDKESQRWSTKIYKVKSMKGLSYIIEDGKETLARRYKPRELLEIKGSTSNKKQSYNGNIVANDEPTVSELVSKQNKKERTLRKEGISSSNRSSKRTRSQNKNNKDNETEIDLR